MIDVTECKPGCVVDFEIVAKKANFHEGDFEERSKEVEADGFQKFDPHAQPSRLPWHSRSLRRLLVLGPFRYHLVMEQKRSLSRRPFQRPVWHSRTFMP
jgi:hypothetical protein